MKFQKISDGIITRQITSSAESIASHAEEHLCTEHTINHKDSGHGCLHCQVQAEECHVLHYHDNQAVGHLKFSEII
jgi:hypothetical protein